MFTSEAHDGQVSGLLYDTPKRVCTVRKSPEGACEAEPVPVPSLFPKLVGTQEPARSQGAEISQASAQSPHPAELPNTARKQHTPARVHTQAKLPDPKQTLYLEQLAEELAGESQQVKDNFRPSSELTPAERQARKERRQRCSKYVILSKRKKRRKVTDFQPLTAKGKKVFGDHTRTATMLGQLEDA